MTPTPQTMTALRSPATSLDNPTAEKSDASRSIVWRELRLRKHADYQSVYRSTRKQFSASMTWFLATRPPVGLVENGTTSNVSSAKTKTVVGAFPELPRGPRVGLTVGKVIGKAHERNRIKRRMRETIRQHWLELPADVDLILHPRRSVMTMDFVKLEAEVLRIFRQVKAQSANPSKISARPAQPKSPSPTVTS